MKKWGIRVIVVAMSAAAIFVFIKSASPTLQPPQQTVASQNTVAINGHVINVDVADTEAAREKGLGGRDSLAKDSGMLFVFQKDGTYAFWMKDMKFNIDIVWISADGHIVDIRENVSPDTFPTAFSPKAPARYVLELSADAVKGLNAHIGDIVRL
jgi:uncharacterized membrane protein (UPF0127 family)